MLWWQAPFCIVGLVSFLRWKVFLESGKRRWASKRLKGICEGNKKYFSEHGNFGVFEKKQKAEALLSIYPFNWKETQQLLAEAYSKKTQNCYNSCRCRQLSCSYTHIVHLRYITHYGYVCWIWHKIIWLWPQQIVGFIFSPMGLEKLKAKEDATIVEQ